MYTYTDTRLDVGSGRPKAPPATQNASQKFQGIKNKELKGGGAKLKFDQLIFMKIIKIVATRCDILSPKCTKFDLPMGSAQRSPDPLDGFKGSYF